MTKFLLSTERGYIKCAQWRFWSDCATFSHVTTCIHVLSGTAFVKGFKATSKILKGSKEIPSNNMLERVYKKTGSYNQAKRDFFSVRPTNIYNTPVRIRSFQGCVQKCFAQYPCSCWHLSLGTGTQGQTHSLSLVLNTSERNQLYNKSLPLL